jgi:hypothetical protein
MGGRRVLMSDDLTATANVTIHGSLANVWDALTEQARDESQRNWGMMLAGLKKVVES